MRKKYSTVSSNSENQSRMKDSDTISVVSVASSHRRFAALKRNNAELSEPLTADEDEAYGGGSSDPYFVFRSDLQDQLELVDDFLAEYLRTVYEIVRIINAASILWILNRNDVCLVGR
jgi:hypothetical protein